MSAFAHTLNREIIEDLYAILGNGFYEIVDEQSVQVAEYLKELAHLLRANRPDEAMRRAHALKSSSGQIGLLGIHQLAADLEQICRYDSDSGKASPKALQIHAILCEEFPSAMQTLRGYMASNLEQGIMPDY